MIPIEDRITVYSENALAAQLPWWEVLDDLVVCVDGTYVVGLKLEGIVNEHLSADELTNISYALEAFVNGARDQTEYQFYYVSRPGSASVYSRYRQYLESLNGTGERVRAINAERLERLGQLQCFEREIFLFVPHRPERLFKGGLERIAFYFGFGRKRFRQVLKEEHDQARSEMDALAEEVQSALLLAGIKSRRLKTDEYVRLMYEAINPGRAERVPPPRIRDGLSLREQIALCDYGISKGFIYSDGYFRAVVTMKQPPTEVYPCFLEPIMYFPEPIVVSVRLRIPNKAEEQGRISWQRKMSATLMTANPIRGVVDTENQVAYEEQTEALAKTYRGAVRPTYLCVTCFLKSETLRGLRDSVSRLERTIQQMSGAEALQEEAAIWQLFTYNLPASVSEDLRFMYLTSDAAAQFLPVFSTFRGSRRPALFFTNRYNEAVFLDPFELSSSHALVIGTTGGGKSFLMNYILMQMLNLEELEAIFVIDKGGSYRKLAAVCGGEYFDVRLDNPIQINPFEFSGKRPSSEKIAFLVALVERMMKEEGEHLSRDDRRLIEECIRRTYDEILGLGRVPLLSDLREVMQKHHDARAKNLSSRLYPWTGDRIFGRFLDRPGRGSVSGRLVVFDLEGIKRYPDLNQVVILSLSTIFGEQIESKAVGKKSIFLIDESWAFLRDTGDLIPGYFRTGRKQGVAVYAVSPTLQDIVNSTFADAMINNSIIRFIFRQRGDHAPLAKHLHLEEHDIELIRSLKMPEETGYRYSEFFCQYGDRRAVLQLRPTPLEYWIATMDDQDLAYLAKCMRNGGQLLEAIRAASSSMPNGVRSCLAQERN